MSRHKQLSTQTIVHLFAMFGIDIVARLNEQPPAKRIAEFESAKDDAKAEFKRLAFEHHPDRGGDAERFKELSAGLDKLQGIEMRLPPPPPRHQAITIHFNPVMPSTISTTTGSRMWGGGTIRWR